MTEKNSLDLEDLIAEEPRTRISAAEACSVHDYCRGGYRMVPGKGFD